MGKAGKAWIHEQHKPIIDVRRVEGKSIEIKDHNGDKTIVHEVAEVTTPQGEKILIPERHIKKYPEGWSDEKGVVETEEDPLSLD